MKKYAFAVLTLFLFANQNVFGQNLSDYDENRKINWVSINKLEQERYSASRKKAQRFLDCEIITAQEHRKKGHEYFMFTYFDCSDFRLGSQTYRLFLTSIGFENSPSVEEILEHVDATTEAGIRNSLAAHRGGKIFSVSDVLSDL